MCFHGPARAVAHAMWCAILLLLWFVVFMHMSDQSLGAVVGVQRTLLAVSATQPAFDVLTLARPAGENLVK